MSEKWNMIVDVARCENCHNCVLATKDEHEGNSFPGYSAPMPRHGHEWIKLTRKVRGRSHMVDTAYLPTMCNHCDDAPCQKVGRECVIKRDDGIVLIDPLKAKGRKDLVDACPHGHIWWNEELELPQNWTFDAHLIDQGWNEPRASQACPTGALEVAKITDAQMKKRAEAEELETLAAEGDGKPRVWYKNLYRFTKAFLGGSVHQKINGVVDVVEGATVTLTQNGNKLSEVTTDMFGDFKFDGLVADGTTYEIQIQHEGKQAKTDANLTDSLVLDPIQLSS